MTEEWSRSRCENTGWRPIVCWCGGVGDGDYFVWDLFKGKRGDSDRTVSLLNDCEKSHKSFRTVPNSELCAIRQLRFSFMQSLVLDTDNQVDLAANASSAGLTRLGRRRLRPQLAKTARGRLDT
jgi:hypothetical protein